MRVMSCHAAKQKQVLKKSLKGSSDALWFEMGTEEVEQALHTRLAVHLYVEKVA